MRIFALLCGLAAAWILASRPAAAQDFMQGPAYARMRPGADDWRQRGDGNGYAGRHGRGYGGYYDPYFYGYGGPVIQGSWYQRPYPYHFDYYRHRWGGEPGDYVRDVPPPNDCPCADESPLAGAPPAESPSTVAP